MQKIRSILIVVFFMFLVFSLSKNIVDYRRDILLHDTIRSRYEEIKKENTRLKTNSRRHNDPDELERTIRNKLNMVKENEVAVILAAPTPTIVPPTPTPHEPYLQWLYTFGLREME